MTTEAHHRMARVDNAPQASAAASERTLLTTYNAELARLKQVLGGYGEGLEPIFLGPGGLPEDSEDLSRFVDLVDLILQDIGVPNKVALTWVREFAAAETELANLHILEQKLIDSAFRADLLARIEAGLQKEGMADQEIKEQARKLRRSYSQDFNSRVELTRRFNLPDLNSFKAEVVGGMMNKLAQIKQLMRVQERRRDQALKTLDYFNRLQARRLRDLARERDKERQRAGVGDASGDA
jgi:hypothetical protein